MSQLIEVECAFEVVIWLLSSLDFPLFHPRPLLPLPPLLPLLPVGMVCCRLGVEWNMDLYLLLLFGHHSADEESVEKSAIRV